MVFLIKGEATLPVGLLYDHWCGDSGSTTDMDDLGRWCESDESTTRPDRGAKVDVFGIEMESLVQKANRFGIGAAHQ